MEISVKTDFKDVNKLLKASKSVQRQAAASAINDGLKKIRTVAKRSMAKELKVKQKYLKYAYRIRKASRRTLHGRMDVKPFAIPLEWIPGSQNKTGYKPRGMKVRRHTFQATMPSGHTGVYVRSSKAAGKVRGRPGDYKFAPSGRVRRLSIITAFAGNTTRAFNKKHIMEAVKVVGRETFNNRYVYHVKRLRARNLARGIR